MGKQIVLIVDSDASVRRELGQLIRQQLRCAVSWECCNGLEAIKYINALQPDLVVMDVRLPGKDGFEVLETTEYAPSVIFTANSPEHAARAFEYYAVDYLVKPFSPTRLELALCRFEQLKAVALQESDLGASPKDFPSRILVENGNRLTSIPVDNITHLKADRDYTWIHAINGKCYLSTNGIGRLERKLDTRRFIRIHRSYIVNIEYIQELYRDISKLFVALPNDVEINVGRNYLPAIKELMF